MRFQSQNRRFRVYEEGDWKDFQNYSLVSNLKGESYTFSLIISSTTESPFFIVSLHKNIFTVSRDTIPLNLGAQIRWILIRNCRVIFSRKDPDRDNIALRQRNNIFGF
jgi:hypothetical protein